MNPAQREAVARVLYERGGLGGSWTRITGRLRDLYLLRADEIIAAYEAASGAEDPLPPGPPEGECGPSDDDLMGDWCSPVNMEAQ